MSENMNAAGTQTGNAGEGVQGTGQTGKGTERMFTQDEVNGFVQSRVARMKGQIEKDAKAEYDVRLAELEARELKLSAKETLQGRGLPEKLADIITYTDKSDLEKKLDALDEIYKGRGDNSNEHPAGFKIGFGGGAGKAKPADPIRAAMGLEKKEG